LRKPLAVPATVALLAATVGSVYLFVRNHPDYAAILQGFGAQLGHLVLFAALAWAAYAVGRIFSRLVLRRETWWEVDTAVGLFLFGMLAFALAALHLLYPWVIRVVVLAAVAASAPLAARYLREGGGWLRARLAASDPATVVLGALVAPFVFMLWAQAAAPPTYADALVYHLYLPKYYAARHGFEYLPRMAYASMPLGAEMTFTWAYLWDGLGVAAAVAPLFNSLAAVATWRLARRYVDGFWALFAAAVLLFTPTFSAFFAAAYVDFVVAAFALMALNVYLDGLKRTGDAVLTGILLGAAVGVKYTGAYGALALVPLLAADLARRRVAPGKVVLVVAVALLAFAPWLAKAWVERGNPVFPSLYGVFGARDMSADVAAAMERWQRGIGMGRGVLDYLMLPYRVSMDAGAGYAKFDGAMWPFAMLTLGLALVWFRRWRIWVYTFGYFVGWAFLASQQLRFLSAAFGCLAVVTAGVFAGAADAVRGRGKTWARAALVGVVLVAGYGLNVNVVGDAGQALEYLAAYNPTEYLRLLVGVYRADEFINKSLPGNARVLMIFENRLLYLDRPAVYDSFFEASETLLAVQRMQSPDEVAAYVHGLRATHLLTSRYQLNYFWHYYEPATRQLWNLYLAEYTRVLYDDGQFEIRAVEGP